MAIPPSGESRFSICRSAESGNCVRFPGWRIRRKYAEEGEVKKRLIYGAVLALLGFGVVEFVSYGGLIRQEKRHNSRYEPADAITARHSEIIKRMINRETTYTDFSARLGWSIKENGRSRLYRANSSGIRGDKEYSVDPPPGVIRISTFGDSFGKTQIPYQKGRALIDPELNAGARGLQNASPLSQRDSVGTRWG